MEIFKDIKNFEGLYAVSDEGNFNSLDRDVIDVFNGKQRIRHFKGRPLTPRKIGFGHLQLRLRKDGKYYDLLCHQLVAQTFIQNPNGYDTVHHKDHDKTNNRVENLCWIDGHEHHALHASEHCKTVYQYNLDGLLVNVWKSAVEIEKVLGFCRKIIYDCCNSKYCRKGNNKYKGYIWSHSPL